MGVRYQPQPVSSTSCLCVLVPVPYLYWLCYCVCVFVLCAFYVSFVTRHISIECSTYTRLSIHPYQTGSNLSSAPFPFVLLKFWHTSVHYEKLSSRLSTHTGRYTFVPAITIIGQNLYLSSASFFETHH